MRLCWQHVWDPRLPAPHPPATPGQLAKGRGYCLNCCYSTYGYGYPGNMPEAGDLGLDFSFSFSVIRMLCGSGRGHHTGFYLLASHFSALSLESDVCQHMRQMEQNMYSKCPLRNKGMLSVTETCIQAGGYLLDTPWFSVSKVGILWGRYITAYLLESPKSQVSPAQPWHPHRTSGAVNGSLLSGLSPALPAVGVSSHHSY